MFACCVLPFAEIKHDVGERFASATWKKLWKGDGKSGEREREMKEGYEIRVYTRAPSFLARDLVEIIRSSSVDFPP